MVGTPIGNLGDIGLRALEVLRRADLVLAEDTRRSGRLLQHYGIKAPLTSCHQGNEAGRGARVVEAIRGGAVVALVTDAGTPGVSDPGERVVAACYEAGVPVRCVPGPSAVAAAISICGFAIGEFVFGGFLPPQSGGRRKRLEAYAVEARAVVLFESPYRLLRLLDDIATLMPERTLFVGRELTKKFEEGMLGDASRLRARFENRSVKGEFVLVLAPLRKRRASGGPAPGANGGDN